MKILLGIDSSTRSIGSQYLIDPLKKLAQSKKAQFITTGGYGLYFLEPLVEIEYQEKKYAFSHIETKDIKNLINTDGKPNFKHPKYLSETKDIPALKVQNRFTFKKAGLIDPISLEDYQKQGGLVGLKKALKLSASQIVEEIKKSGLRGRGGAGFPTGIKWQTVLAQKEKIKYIVANADEGDSGTFADRLIMESDPFSLIEGMIIAAKAVGARQGFIYLRSEYPFTYDLTIKVLDKAYQFGLLGKNILSSDFSFDIQLRKGAGSYICGEETALLESLEGKRGVIRYKPPLPAIEGLFGKPTVINNVITLATVPEIMAQGAEVYQSFGYQKSKGTLSVQLSGNVKNAGLYELNFGISLNELIYDIGGGTYSGKAVKAVQVGGPLGAYFPQSLFDTPLDYESFSAKDALVGHGGVVVFDQTADLSLQARFAFEFCAHESCGKCTPCRIGSTRGAETIEQMRQNKNFAQNKVLVEDLCELMEQTSLCALGGLTPYPVKSILQYFPEDFSYEHQ